MVDSTPLIPENDNRKRGHRVLCCCDSRKAVIMINSIGLILVIVGLIASAVENTLDSSIPAIVAYCVSILFYFLVICSALQFRRCAVILGIIWTGLSIVLVTVGLILDRAMFAQVTDKTPLIVYFTAYYVLHVFIIYAESIYVSEVGKGIMTRETHYREKYSCCCNV